MVKYVNMNSLPQSSVKEYSCCGYPDPIYSDNKADIICGSCGLVYTDRSKDYNLVHEPGYTHNVGRPPPVPQPFTSNPSKFCPRLSIDRCKRGHGFSDKLLESLCSLHIESLESGIAEMFAAVNRLPDFISLGISDKRLCAVCVLIQIRLNKIPITLKNIAVAFGLTARRLLRDLNVVRPMIPEIHSSAMFDIADYSSMMCKELLGEVVEGYLKDFKILFDFSADAGLLTGRSRNVMAAVVAILAFEVYSQKGVTPELVNRISAKCSSNPTTVLRRRLELKNTVIKHAIQYPFFRDLNKKNFVGLLPEILVFLDSKNGALPVSSHPPSFVIRELRRSKLAEIIDSVESKLERTIKICDIGTISASSLLHIELEEDTELDSLKYKIEQMLLSGMKSQDVLDFCDRKFSNKVIFRV